MHAQASEKERLEQEKLVQELELKRRAKTIVVPTDDGKVRHMLRQLNEPVTLFGEKEVRCSTQEMSPFLPATPGQGSANPAGS
jgi:U4/U6 small nuclear ribonucleoprotein PRP4